MFSSFIKYYLRSDTKYKVHSPFVFDFIENVLEDDRVYYAFPILEKLRKGLLKNKHTIKITDLGAGSRKSNNAERSIAQITKTAVSPPAQCRLLFRLINHYHPKTLLEMGTSMGLTSLYQALAATKGQMFTLEGDPLIANIAQSNFSKLDAKHIQLIQGNFENTLGTVFQQIERLDYAFLDGNHRKIPTLKYFEECLSHVHAGSIFVIDDIHWSSEMEMAWATIKQNQKVRLTIDLFYAGIVFFRNEQKEKEHYTLIHSKYKPWQTGFFG